jgi:hypothetical protein
MKEPGRGPELREALFEDYEQIIRLEDKYDLETKSREEWEHIFFVGKRAELSFRVGELLPLLFL